MGGHESQTKIAEKTWTLVCTMFAFMAVIVVGLATGIIVLVLCIHWSVLIFSCHSVPISHGLVVVLLFSSILLLCNMIDALLQIRSVQRSDLMEINAADYPELFRLIDDVGSYMGISRPCKVYLSSTVSASIFLTGGFVGCFFPTKKNLEIGLGLINILNQKELGAVLAHEFGHFSQRSVYLNGPLYSMFQLMMFLTKNIEFKKRGIIENQYYVLPYMLRFLLDMLSPVMSKKKSQMLDELELDADRISADYGGVVPLISALYKVSNGERTFNETCRRAMMLIRGGMKIEDIYVAHAVTNRVKNRALGLGYVRSDIDGCQLSRIVKLRIERLKELTDRETDNDCMQKASLLIPEFHHLCRKFSDSFYNYQMSGDVPQTFEVMDTRRFILWSVMMYQREKSKPEVAKTDIRIMMRKRLHRLPVSDFYFDVYLDNRKIGRHWYKRGFCFDTSLSPGFHKLSFRGIYVSNDTDFEILIMARSKCIVDVVYSYRLMRTEYVFSVESIKYVGDENTETE